ncbi:kinase [Virgibacillus profundi]|uniref:Kinase n=1 Tax=Virgibacillus profundi TaxID=2024555 RepID=A0A2A2IHN7_9BACI|nr:ROK family protein [Virgibacillus profundi]PAV31147.1 kinase [Virgibacillus profundi]PXY55330.1 ROK family protein [Virgibacillus profundi]
MAYTIGVDIGGTKVAAVIIDEYEEILHRKEIPSNTRDKETMFRQVLVCIENLLAESEIPYEAIAGMGVGVPGKVDRENGIAVFQNNLPWRNFPLVARLQEHFPFPNVAIENDVYMAAFAEWQAMDASDEDTFVYLTVSTGISCSIIQHGKFLRGTGFAGEIGLLPVLAKSSPGGVNILEKSASGTAIQELAIKHFNKSDITTEEVFLEYQKGNETARSLIGEVVESLAHGIYSIICLLDPQKIILGGGVINKQPYLLDLVKKELMRFLIPEQQHVLQHMHASHFKENSGLVGAGFMGKGSGFLTSNL